MRVRPWTASGETNLESSEGDLSNKGPAIGVNDGGGLWWQWRNDRGFEWRVASLTTVGEANLYHWRKICWVEVLPSKANNGGACGESCKGWTTVPLDGVWGAWKLRWSCTHQLWNGLIRKEQRIRRKTLFAPKKLMLWYNVENNNIVLWITMNIVQEWPIYTSQQYKHYIYTTRGGPM